MRKELDDLLCERYPLIFADRHRPMQETAMCWGFSCGDGWFDIIDTACRLIQQETDKNGAPQLVAVQVKEKFGTLRFYCRGAASERQREIIREAESMTERTCEECGSLGRTLATNTGWVMTRCPEHAPDDPQYFED